MTDYQLNHTLLELREVLADALTMTDIIRQIGPAGDHLLPNLRRELGTLQVVVRRVRRLLPRS
jgi:fructose 1,6-bisphosphatase